MNDSPEAGRHWEPVFNEQWSRLKAIYRNLADILVCWCRWRRRCSCSGLFLWQSAAGSAVRTLEDTGCRTKLFWQQQRGHRSLAAPQSLYLAASRCRSCSHLLLLLLPASLSLSLSLSADSFPLPYVMESHLHISLTHTCSLSHASAQPTLPLLLSTAVPIALIPPLLTFSTSPPYHTEPTLKPSFLTSLRHHAAPRPPSEFRM